MSADEPQLISATTISSLFFTVVLLAAAYALSLAVLPGATSRKERGIYIWHAFDALTHLILEGSFVYLSLTASSPAAATADTSSGAAVLWGDPAVSYGVRHSDTPLGQLWQEYARADLRWGVSDVTTVCIELITVVLAGPLALWVAEMVRKRQPRRWFWIAVLATCEIYGGWMTFAPEWLSGNRNLVTSNWMYKWLYLGFFNFVWVAIPGWLLYESYWQMVPATEQMQKTMAGEKRKVK